MAVLALGLPAVCATRPGVAQVSGVPAALQAKLLAKLEAYDHNFAARAGDTARVLILTKPASVKSQIAADSMKSSLAGVDLIGGLPHTETVVPYPGAGALARRCRDEHVSVVVVTPDFDDDIDAIRESLTDGNVLTLASVPDYVPRGIVLGFDLDSGRPKAVINLGQAKRQGVLFSSDVLRLMTVYR